MGEELYKSMKSVGALNIALGVVVLIVGIAAGVMMLIGGSKLLTTKSKILF
ncbi:MAG: hypothetical protein R3Y67_05945 [Eubacteriales bacterium]